MGQIANKLKGYTFVDPKIILRIEALEREGNLPVALAEALLRNCEKSDKSINELRIQELETIIEMQGVLKQSIQKTEKSIIKSVETATNKDAEASAEELLSDI